MKGREKVISFRGVGVTRKEIAYLTYNVVYTFTNPLSAFL